MRSSGKINSSLLGSLFIVCLGCSSGGGEPEPNQLPTVSAAKQEVLEGAEVSITATASDLDGSITNYSWSQVSGENVALEGDNSQTLSFIAPTVIANTDLVFNIQVEDNDGATASTDVVITILADMKNLTIEGIATDSPISGANIIFTLGEQSFTTTADDNGFYSIEINLDDSFENEQVIAAATGPEEGSIVKLRSLLGDFGSLIKNAGEDNTLDKNEMFSVNITHVSTAIAALMELANGGEKITSKDEFKHSVENYDGSKVLQLATAIKLVVDYSANEDQLQLPSSVTNTDELVKNLTVAGEYLNSAEINFAEQVAEARDSIISDDQAIASGSANANIAIADSYFFISPNGSAADGRMILNADGSGIIYQYDGSISINWSVDEDGVAVAYQDGPRILSTSVAYIDGLPADVQLISLGKNIKWLVQTESADQLMISETTYRHYPNGESADEAPITNERFHNAIKTAGVLDAANILQMNTTYAFPVPQVSEEIQNSKSEGVLFSVAEFTRNENTMFFTGNTEQGGSVTVTTRDIDGEGSITYNSKVMQWHIATNGHLIITGEQTFDYAFLQANDTNTPFVNVLNDDGELTKASADNALAKGSSVWTNDTAEGIYDLAWNAFDPLQYFWVEVNSDGTSLTVSTYDSNSNGLLDDNEFALAPGRWQINASGNLVIRRYRNNTLIDGSFDYCTPASWDPADSDACLLFHEREWDLYQVKSSGEYYMNHLHRFYDDAARAWMTDPNVAGHILGTAISDIRYWTKVEQRPLDLPVAQITQAKVSEQQSFNRVD